MAISVAATFTFFGTLGWIAKAIAGPAQVLVPYLDEIQRNLPPGLTMRLPSKILLGGPADAEFINTIKVQVTQTVAPAGLTVRLLSCDHSPLCWIGSFSVSSTDSRMAQQEYQQHLEAVRPITLNNKIRGYVIDDILQRPSVTVSSVMWKQDGQFYSARFATPERQNMLYMAVSMANNEPVYAFSQTLQNLPVFSLR